MYILGFFFKSFFVFVQVLEYLLWACTCLETSITLLTANFLPWRATLYCAVCECYFQDSASVQAEVGFTQKQCLKLLDKLSYCSMTDTRDHIGILSFLPLVVPLPGDRCLLAEP